MVEVTNIGGARGSRAVQFVIEGVLEYSPQVTLAPGGSAMVVCTMVKHKEGTYQVAVDGFTARFVVSR
jgi:hypothetical protein